MAGRRNDNPQAKIIVRHYPPDTSDKDLRIMFEKYGKIDDCEYLQRLLMVYCFLVWEGLLGLPTSFSFIGCP